MSRITNTTNINNQAHTQKTSFIFNVNDFIEKNGFNNKELIRTFFSMIDLKCEMINDIIPRSYMSSFMVNMLKDFEKFDELPGKLIINQFITLAEKCETQGKKLLIGEKINAYNNVIGVDTSVFIQDKYVHVNFSEELVKEAMKNPIYIIQQEGSKIPEIKAIPLGCLVTKQENLDLDNPNADLIAKCAAYLLFHELFHANSFIDNIQFNDPKKFAEAHENFSKKDIEQLLASESEYDDFRNVTSAAIKGEKIVPGEYELLQALYPDRKIMRLYMGKYLDFSKTEVLDACKNVAQIKDSLEEESLVDQYKNICDQIEEKLKKYKDLYIESTDSQNTELTDSQKIKYGKFKYTYEKMQALKNYLENPVKTIKIDNSIWEYKIQQYEKTLEDLQKEHDQKTGNYIPN